MSRILIVEDEEAIADLEKDYLELSDFEVKIENTGDAGLETALAEEFDLIILDLMLPGMDGFEVCKHIREKKDVPILMVSAKKDDIDKIRGLGLGADDYRVEFYSYQFFNLVHIRAFRSHINIDHLNAKVLSNGKVSVISWNRAEEFNLIELAPWSVTHDTVSISS